MTHRILIIGGTGVFGKRLARHLSKAKGLQLFISSRSLRKAEQFVRTLDNPKATGIALDHQTTLQARLDKIKPFAVIDCSGPFQNANFDTARRVIAAGAHLIDLADARDYLANFAVELDGLARTKNVCALTGASSTPTLSACVVDDITQGWQRVESIDISITPGGKSEVGRAVIAAILSYAGKDIPVWRDGHLVTATGWTNASHIDIPNLGHRRVALVETYDAETLGPRHNVQSRVTFSAGLESRIEQFGIEMIAHLRKRRLLPNPTSLIPLLLQARRVTRIPTSDKGGMLVDISGVGADGRHLRAKWSLIARNDHGPNIPILPAAAMLQKLIEEPCPAGAAMAHEHLTLDNVLAQMADYDITTQTDIVSVI